MRITKGSQVNVGTDEEHFIGQVRALDNDVAKLYQAISGRLRLGDGTDGVNGENLAGQFQQFTSSATPNAENTIAHTLGSIPIGYIIIWKDKASNLYGSPTSGTSWTSSNFYCKCDIASVTFLIFLLK